MKILHVIFSLQIGGSETMLVDILNEQVKNSDHSINVLIINDNYNQRLLNKIDSRVNKILLCRQPNSFSIRAFFMFNWNIKRLCPNVIHFHNHDAIKMSFMNTSQKKYLTVHDIGLSEINWSQYNSLFAISQAVQHDIYMRSELNAKLVYNGIHIDSVRKKKYELDKKNFKIVQIGRLDHEKKGQDILIKALSAVRNSCPDIEIEVDFIGEGASLSYLEQVVVEYGLDDVVTFLGIKDRDFVYQNLCNYDLLVHPSHYEGFGLIVVEAMAAKVPVLVSDNDGPMEIIENGKYGFYFQKGNIEDCAFMIERIIRMESLEELCERAYSHVKEKFEIEKTAERYLELY